MILYTLFEHQAGNYNRSRRIVLFISVDTDNLRIILNYADLFTGPKGVSMGDLRSISQSEEPFWDRAEAGRLLGNEFLDLSGKGPIVLGIPKNGVIVAREIARRLDAELDIIVSRKLCDPRNPDVVIGAINEEGELIPAED